MQIDTMWFALGFVGIVIAITRGKEESKNFGKIAILNTTFSGIVFSILSPMLLRDYFEVDKDGLLWTAAFFGGLMGMKFVAALHKIDFAAILTKKIGG